MNEITNIYSAMVELFRVANTPDLIRFPEYYSIKDQLERYYGPKYKNIDFCLDDTKFFHTNFYGVDYWLGKTSRVIHPSYRVGCNHCIVFDGLIKCVVIENTLNNSTIHDTIMMVESLCEAIIGFIDSNVEMNALPALYSAIWFMYDEYRIDILSDEYFDTTIEFMISHSLLSFMKNDADDATIKRFIKEDAKYCNLKGSRFPDLFKLGGIRNRFKLFISEEG